MLLVVGVIASAAILVSTGAAPLASGTDEIPDADIEMRPADGPNGDYAVLNSDDEIELLLAEANPYIEGEGISEDTVTNLDRVFTINYTGDEYAEVWITDDAEDVHFFRGDEPADSIEGNKNSVVLSPDSQTVRVGLHVDTRGENDVESVTEFTVHAQGAEPDDNPTGGVSTNQFESIPDGETSVTEMPPETETPAATETPTEIETPTATATPTETETQTGGSGSAVDPTDVPTTETSENVSNAGPRLPVEEPQGIGPQSLPGVVGGLFVTVLALRAWRLWGGAV